jgi:hypothetical protein
LSEELKKQLWLESNYGCSVCGSPIFAGLRTFSSEVDPQSEDKLIPVCPKCITNIETGTFSTEFLLGYKKNPYNKRNDVKKFLFEGDKLVINVGSTRFVDVSRILVINDFDLINVTKRDNNRLVFDINFFDLASNFVGSIVNNVFTVEDKSKWNVDYNSSTLMIKNVPRKIFLNFSLTSAELAITGRIYYMGHAIQLNQDSVLLDETDLTMGTKNVTISNVGAAFDVQI